jgi:hypothetical protein
MIITVRLELDFRAPTLLCVRAKRLRNRMVFLQHTMKRFFYLGGIEGRLRMDTRMHWVRHRVLGEGKSPPNEYTDQNDAKALHEVPILIGLYAFIPIFTPISQGGLSIGIDEAGPIFIPVF